MLPTTKMLGFIRSPNSFWVYLLAFSSRAALRLLVT